VGATGPRPFTQGFFAALQNEVFVNIGDPSPVNGKFFDQNRAYLAVGYRWSRQFDLEMGYRTSISAAQAAILPTIIYFR